MAKPILNATGVAVVGLGQMGAGIARNLDRAGILNGAFDTDSEAFADLGVSENVCCAPVTQLCEIANILLFAVPSTGVIRSSLEGCQGRQGQIVIDVTTSSPAESRALAQDLAAEGRHYLDAAMTGGAAGADAGQLTLMVGGRADVLAACRPVFDAIASDIFHIGPAGSGHAMKLVHNMILHSNFLANCEGLRMAERAGLDLQQAVAVINAGNARSFVSEVRFPRDILSGAMNARSHVSNLEKDLGLAVDYAAQLQARAPFAALTRAVLAEAVSAGKADADFSWLFPAYDDLVDRLEADA
ncbi:MAG TPA: NAD(P)-dependent oxidoreductase [Afifellaceae bacterium]|nr:NAD(P)-dependent oxidoreductase [Afifellaceae bacterium]